MTQFTRKNGDLKPVFHSDVAGYTWTATDDVTANVAVQLGGPKLDFFTTTATGTLTGTQVYTAVKAIQQLGVINIYQYGNATNNTLAFAVYPVGAWTTTTIDAALANVGITGTTTTLGASFTAPSDV